MYLVYLLHVYLPKQVAAIYDLVLWCSQSKVSFPSENKQIVVGDRTNTLSFLTLLAIFVEQVQDFLFVYADKIRSLILKFLDSRKALHVILFLSLSITVKK